MFLTVPVLRPSAPPRILLTPVQKAERATRRRKRWVGFSIVLSLLAVGVEGKFHLCASNLFDPLPDLVTGIAYAWAVFFLWFNQAVLSTPTEKPTTRQYPLLLHWLGPKRATGIALAGMGVALLVAGNVPEPAAGVLLFVGLLMGGGTTAFPFLRRRAGGTQL